MTLSNCNIFIYFLYLAIPRMGYITYYLYIFSPLPLIKIK